MKHQIVMDELKEKLDDILNLLENKDKVVFVDYPIYLNIGDLIIWQGTEDFFEKNNINIVARYSDLNFDINVINEYFSDCVIICQGGGNFGDTYRTHQHVRDELVKKFEGKVIVLPQSVDFKSQDNSSKTIELYQSKKNLFLCGRDEYSYNYFSKINRNTLLLPDMAHYSWESHISYKKGNDELFFIRRDYEASETNFRYMTDRAVDWMNYYSYFDRFMLKLCRTVAPYCKSPLRAKILSKVWKKYSDFKLWKTKKFFLNYKNVITSRLHGHIYSCLLSIPNKTIDNSYKKNSRYYKQWTSRSDITDFES
ncbi:Putative pyruvyl transferase EpsO [Allocatenococcus thiocycli]|nr:Putative pyruvyl transferase EpsO [Catenococcus thiocycli]